MGTSTFPGGTTETWNDLSVLTTRGDLVYGSSGSPKGTRLGIGGANTHINSDGTDVAWAANETFAGLSPLTTRGDILLATSGTTTGTRLAVGGATEVLTSDGTDAAWAAAGGGVVTRLGGGQGQASGATTGAATNLDTVAISGLTVNDFLYVITTNSYTNGSGVVQLYNSTDSVVLVALASSANNYLLNTNTIACARDDADDIFINSDESGGFRVTFTTAYTGSWTLAYRQTGLDNGGSPELLDWAWSVYKFSTA